MKNSPQSLSNSNSNGEEFGRSGSSSSRLSLRQVIVNIKCNIVKGDMFIPKTDLAGSSVNCVRTHTPNQTLYMYYIRMGMFPL